MINEFTNISIIGQLVVFFIIKEGNVHLTIFLDLLEIKGGKKYATVTFYCLVNHLRNWELD